MKTKAKTLLLSVVLSGASAGFAAPVQAHHNDDSGSYFGIGGLILLDSHATHHHSHVKHRYYDTYRSHYKHRRHHRHHDGGKCYRKHKHRRRDWDDDDDD